MTGRGAGYCAGGGMPGFMSGVRGMGAGARRGAAGGRGFGCGGFGWRANASLPDEREILQNRAGALERELDALRVRLNSLEKKG